VRGDTGYACAVMRSRIDFLSSHVEISTIIRRMGPTHQSRQQFKDQPSTAYSFATQSPRIKRLRVQAVDNKHEAQEDRQISVAALKRDQVYSTCNVCTLLPPPLPESYRRSIEFRSPRVELAAFYRVHCHALHAICFQTHMNLSLPVTSSRVGHETNRRARSR